MVYPNRLASCSTAPPFLSLLIGGTCLSLLQPPSPSPGRSRRLSAYCLHGRGAVSRARQSIPTVRSWTTCVADTFVSSPSEVVVVGNKLPIVRLRETTTRETGGNELTRQDTRPTNVRICQAQIWQDVLFLIDFGQGTCGWVRGKHLGRLLL